MQLGEVQKGFSSKSKLFDSLKVYLDNKNRLQPIIGLGSIIECVKAGTHNTEALYMCEVCMCRLSKADMRNHIIGSLHRYNYIKVWYPHLMSGWKENSDLSKLAWPLMDIATNLEGKEGPGDVQLLEVEDDVYQRVAACSEKDAITLINFLREGQGETTGVQLNGYPSQSHRIVLLGKNQQSKKSLNTEIIPHKASVHTNKTPPLLQSTVRHPIKREGSLKNTLSPQWDHTQISSEPSVLSGNSSFLDGYTGHKPLIGLFRVVECRSEDGRMYCFLCHCCRIRSNKKDIIEHLTSSSHLTNYLRETYPEQVEVMTAAVNDNCQLLQSLAKKVEEKEGRGQLKVVHAPESLCILLTSKSYNWCIKMLRNAWTDVKSRQKKVAIKEPSVNTTSLEDMREKSAVVPSKWAQMMTTKRKQRKATNTVFKVSLPLTKGAVLLERTSFSEDSLPVSCGYSPSFNSDLITSLESQKGDFGSHAVNHTDHTSICTTSQLKQNLFGEDAGTCQYMGPEESFTFPQYHSLSMDGYFGSNKYFCQSEGITGTKDQNMYAERNYNRHHCPQESSSNNFNKDLKNEGFQTQHEELPHTQDGSSYNSSYGFKEGYAAQWYYAVSQNEDGTGVEMSRKEGQKKMGLDDPQHNYQQRSQYMTQDHTHLNMYHYLEGSHALSTSTAVEATEHFHEIEHRQLCTCMELSAGHVPTAPQSYMTQHMAYQAFQVGYGVTYNPTYYTGPGTNNYEQVPHWVGGIFQPNSYIPPWQAPCHGDKQ